MTKRWFALLATFALLAAALPLGSSSYAQGPLLDRKKLTQPRLRFNQGGNPEPAQASTAPSPRPSQPRTGLVSVLVELYDAPAVRVFADRKAGGASEADANREAVTQVARIEQAQQRLLPALANLNARVLYRVQRVQNGIAVRVNADKLDALTAMSGVKAVHVIQPHYRSNATSVPLIGAPELWSRSGVNLTGRNMRIGIIDSGIDYLHTDFGGPGTTTAYRNNDTTRDEPADGFPSTKVVGGYDFVGDEYDANSEDPDVATPHPDPDPMDCNGHGSHVAGTAAGYGVQADGKTYQGPYSTDTPFNSLRIGPGVAPHAKLYALRVFGCEGSTDVTEAAIEWAVDPNGDGDFSDHLDVINMSLGAGFGSENEISSKASDAAVLAGVIVVSSTGNAGETYFNAGSPGSSQRGIAVAATQDAVSIVDAIRVNSPAQIAGLYSAVRSVAYDWANKPGVTGQVVFPASQPSGCEEFTAENAALLNGKIALLQWTEVAPDAPECGSVTRSRNAVAAGAIGVIMYDNSKYFDLFITGSEVVPAVSVPLEVGLTLREHVDEGLNVTLSNELRNAGKILTPELTDVISTFSSQGPSRGLLSKPDLAAPGQSIFSVAALTGNEGTSLNGTSMAAPHVAGSMALLKQLHPTWTVEQLKALAMNTANTDVRSAAAATSPLYGPSRVGAGRITLEQAAASEVIAYVADGSGNVSVSFGAPEVTAPMTMVKSIKVENKGGTSATYRLSYRAASTVPGVSFSFPDGASVMVPARSTRTVRVQLAVDPARMKNTRSETVAELQGNERFWLSEAQGQVILTPSAVTAFNCEKREATCPNLRVPLYSAPRPASQMRAENHAYNFSQTGRGEITLTGQGVMSGSNFPRDILSLVSAFELQARSEQNTELPVDSDAADLRYVGVTSDYPATRSLTDPRTRIYFGVATWANWSSPTTVEFGIYIDTDKDGEDDFVLFNWNPGSASGGNATDVLITYLLDLKTGSLTGQDYLGGVAPSQFALPVYNTNTMVLPVYAADLGLQPNAAFNYSVDSFSRYANDLVDSVEGLTYNPTQPGVDVTNGIVGAPLYADLPGETIPVRFNAEYFTANRSQGMLLLHHHNVTETRAEVVVLGIGQNAFKVYLPAVFQHD